MSANGTFLDKVVGAASQGAVGAVVGATLSAVTEPVVNKVLVERKSIMQALQEHNLEKIIKFFQTTISTNFIKFPFFEVVNMIMNTMSIPPALRGTVTGVVFTSATLPITNFRFRQSMNLPIGGFSGLYQAYLPTVGRDVVYGIARNTMMGWLMAANKDLMKTTGGRFKAMFMTVMFSCVVSAPGNEFRGFVLQPKGREKPFFEFFDPVKTARSTVIGGLIMSTSLATGVACTPYVETLFKSLKELANKDPLGVIVLLAVLYNAWAARQRAARLEKAIAAKGQ
eukprot:TRINITY_DN30456_c0_g4_i1.p2 TRINITY_DN30456_c0_g4~~TRINITY_DN30456_c0_g4_i1.p2  ORF type:complete len:283 (+),score=69.37 TRINITY_DN30456_c0_g4_i1:81-929(+)